MARGAAQTQRRKRETAPPKRKQKQASWEDQLFFARLRHHAKIIYVLLAVAFAAGFVLLGVGSGSSGISDVLGNLFQGGSTSSVDKQIKDDQKKIAANPSNMNAYVDLANLYRQKQDTGSAIRTLERAAKLKPKNVEVLTNLAGLYRNQAEQSANGARDAYNAFAGSNVSPPGLDANSQLGQALTSDPLSQALKTRYSDAVLKVRDSYQKAERAYKRQAVASKGTSNELNAEFQLASVAQQTYGWTGDPADAKVAIAAYRRYLKLEPTGVQADVAKQTIAQLQAVLPKGQR